MDNLDELERAVEDLERAKAVMLRQGGAGFLALGKMDNIVGLLRQALEAGYGSLPAVWSLKAYMERN